ncbi:hypothetical protein [Alcaligenes sp. Marseille-Q7550]
MPLHHSWTAPVDATADPLVHYDAQRRRCPVARDDALQYAVFRHADALRLLLDHDTFSNQASRHRSVPNSMDPPEHGAYRRLIEPYFSAGRLAQFLPACRRISAQCIAALPQDGVADLMSALAHPFALRMQCAFMGWPDSLHEPLRQWVRRKNEATRSGDPQATAQVAQDFEELLARVLADFRRADPPGQDATSRLLRETINGTPLQKPRSPASCATGPWANWAPSPPAWASSPTTLPRIRICRNTCAATPGTCAAPMTKSCAFARPWWPTAARLLARWMSPARGCLPARA